MSCLLSTCLCECGGGGVRKEESGEREEVDGKSDSDWSITDAGSF